MARRLWRLPAAGEIVIEGQSVEADLPVVFGGSPAVVSLVDIDTIDLLADSVHWATPQQAGALILPVANGLYGFSQKSTGL